MHFPHREIHSLTDAQQNFEYLEAQAGKAPVVIAPSGDGSGATDTQNILAAVGTGNVHLLLNGTYWSNGAVLRNIPGVTLSGSGKGTVIRTATAGADALKCVGCDDLLIGNVRFNTAVGSRDGLHLENCQRARLTNVTSGGAARAMIWAQQCYGIVLNGCAPSVAPIAGSGVALPQAGLVLTWDGSDPTSGCNQFVINGGEYEVGQTLWSSTNTSQFMPGWAIQVIRADGGTFAGAPVNELSAGGVFIQFCNNVSGPIGYSEFNPSDITYETGTITVASGATGVVGSGTVWNNTVGGPEVPNGWPGKYLVAPLGPAMEFAKVAGLTDNTHLSIAAQDELLRSGWQGSTLSGSSYRLVGVQLFLDDCLDCNITQQRGGSAIILRSTSRCEINATCEELLVDSACVMNTGTIVTNRVTGLTARIVDFGVNNLFRQINYQTNGIVQDTPLPQYSTSQLAAYSPGKPTVALNSTTGHLNYWNGSAWVAL